MIGKMIGELDAQQVVLCSLCFMNLSLSLLSTQAGSLGTHSTECCCFESMYQEIAAFGKHVFSVDECVCITSFTSFPPFLCLSVL